MSLELSLMLWTFGSAELNENGTKYQKQKYGDRQWMTHKNDLQVSAPPEERLPCCNDERRWAFDGRFGWAFNIAWRIVFKPVSLKTTPSMKNWLSTEWKESGRGTIYNRRKTYMFLWENRPPSCTHVVDELTGFRLMKRVHHRLVRGAGQSHDRMCSRTLRGTRWKGVKLLEKKKQKDTSNIKNLWQFVCKRQPQ